MANIITRTFHFTDGTTAYGSQVESEIANVAAVLNSLNSAGTTWDNVKVTTLALAGNANANGFRIASVGTPTTSGDVAQYPITASQITSGTITATQMASGSITTALLAANAVTQALSSSSGATTDRISTATTQAITTAGGKVLIIASLQATVTTATSGATGNSAITMNVTRGGTSIPGACGSCQTITGTNGQVQNFSPSCVAIDSPAAGTYTYNLTYVTTGSSPSLNFYSLLLVELKA